MSGEVTIPLLPCGDIDETADFYRALGFEPTYRQVKPNPYIVVKREDLQLHFFGLKDFNPEESYGSCVVLVADTWELYQAFAEGMREKYGKLLASGIPRMTRPRKRKNTGNRAGFAVIDPGGNWIRFFPAAEDEGDADEPIGKLGTTLQNAIVLGDSKGDTPQAARILDGALRREGDSAELAEKVEAMVYRAELAVRLDDKARARELLAEVLAMELDDADRDRLAEPLANARDLSGAIA